MCITIVCLLFRFFSRYGGSGEEGGKRPVAGGFKCILEAALSFLGFMEFIFITHTPTPRHMHDDDVDDDDGRL